MNRTVWWPRSLPGMCLCCWRRLRSRRRWRPSEFTPYAILRLAELALEAGVPPGQLAVLSGVGPQTGHALVTHPEVDYVSFTGSTATGARLMADAALSGPRPVSLEMGGKTPQVVFADADLDAAAQFIGNSVVRNAGQICYAGTRLVVDHTIADEMVDRIIKRIGHVEPGPTWSKKTTLAPSLSQRQLDRVVSILQQGKAQGAIAVTGGAVIETGKGGFFFQPTVLRSVEASNPVIRQKIFGPVLAVQPFSDMEEAMSLADHCDYGLGASVYTRNLNTAMKCARAIKSGSVWINCFGVNDIIAPVGGYKKSGFGKDFGQDGMLKYMRSKSILVKSFS
jgi:aldehyde dehydrogenase (NAD+)